MTNLQRRNGTYYFRVRVPAALQHWFGRGEIKKSLRTKRLTQARRLLKLLDFKTEKLFMLMRSGVLTDAQIKQLSKEYIRDDSLEDMTPAEYISKGASTLLLHCLLDGEAYDTRNYFSFRRISGRMPDGVIFKGESWQQDNPS